VYFFGYSCTVVGKHKKKKRQKIMEIFVVDFFFGQKFLWVEKNYCEFKIIQILLLL